MPWWDESSDADSDFINPNINRLNELFPQQSTPQQQGPRPRPTPAPQRPTNRPSQNVPTQQQAQQQAWQQVGQQLAQQVYRPTRPATGPRQDVPTRSQAQQENSWAGVINRLRPALNLPQPQRQITQLGDREPLDSPQPLQVSYGYERPDTGPTRVRASQVINPTTRPSALVMAGRGSTVPRDEEYYTSQETQRKYTWDDMAGENIKALWGEAGNRIRQDWADTFNSGRNQYFNPAGDAIAMQKEITAADENNQKIMQRAYELRQRYYQTQQAAAATVSGEALDFSNPANQVSLDSFIEQAQKELGYGFVTPDAGRFGQALSVGRGLLQNLGQVPVIGTASNLVGNTLGTVFEGINAATRTTVQAPIQVGGPDAATDFQRWASINAAPYPAEVVESDSPVFVSAGEVLGSGLEMLNNPAKWWSNPGSWTYEKNPLTMMGQVWGDNIERVVDTVYKLSPVVGEYRDPLAADSQSETRALITSYVDFSGSQAAADATDAILNKEEHIADLQKQFQAAQAASQNMMLPQDVRDNQAFIAAQTQAQINFLTYADAAMLAQSHVKPIQDAILSMATDLTFWKDIGFYLTGKRTPLSPAQRRLVKVEDLMQTSEDVVKQTLADALGSDAAASPIYKATVQSGLNMTEVELSRAQTFLSHILQGVTTKEDVVTILDQMIKNPRGFIEGIPADLLKSATLKAQAGKNGLLEFPNVQIQQADFNQLANSLKALEGQLVNLPSLKDAKATISDVINDVKAAIEIQSASRNNVSPFSRPVPVSSTEARVYTTQNAAGDLLYMTEYVDKDGRVLARYAAPTEALAEAEVKVANSGIKAGKYRDHNLLVDLTHKMRRGLSTAVLDLWPPSWKNNTIGGWVHSWTTASNTLEPVENAFKAAEKNFPTAPFDYLERGALGQTGNAASALEQGFIKPVLQKLRSVRAGHTEFKLPNGGTIAIGENAFKLKTWWKHSRELLGDAINGAWRKEIEPALMTAEVPEPAIRLLRGGLTRLQQDWDLQKFLDDAMQYAMGNKRKLDIAAAGKQYEAVVSPTMHTALDNVVDNAATWQDVDNGIKQVIDTEIDRVSKTFGYEPEVATIPVSVQDDVTGTLVSLEDAAQGLQRAGVQPAREIRPIQQRLGAIREQAQRIYNLALAAKRPEALQMMREYYDAVAVLRRDTALALDDLAREAKLTRSPEIWNDFYQAKLQYWDEFSQSASDLAEQAMARIRGDAVQAPPVAPVSSIDPAIETTRQRLATMLTQSQSADQEISAIQAQLQTQYAAIRQAAAAGNQAEALRLMQSITDLEAQAADIATRALQAAPAIPTAQAATPKLTPIDEVISYWRTLADNPNVNMGSVGGSGRTNALQAMRKAEGLKRSGVAFVDETDIMNPVYYTAEQAAQRTASVAPAAPAVAQAAPPVIPLDISNANVANYRNRKWLFPAGNFAEATEFFRRAEELSWESFFTQAQQTNDFRAMDIYLQVQQDIERIKATYSAQLRKMKEAYDQAASTYGSGTKQMKAANDAYYGPKGQMFYDQGLQINARIKAGIAYLTNLPEPVTFAHAQYGDVAIVGIHGDSIALQLPSGQIINAARDAAPAEALVQAEQRLAAIKASSAAPMAQVSVAGHPQAFVDDVNKLAGDYYNQLMAARQNMYKAPPNVTMATADTLNLLNGLRNKSEVLAQNLFKQMPGTAMQPKQMAAFLDGVNHVKSQWRKWLEPASLHGHNMASFNMIDNVNRYRGDEIASVAFPFWNWSTRMGKNLAEHLLTQPVVRHAINVQDAIYEQINGDAAKQYVDIPIGGGRSVRVYASMGNYLTNATDWTADPTYAEQRQINGPLGGIYAVGQAAQARTHPMVDTADNIIRALTGQETIERGGMRYQMPQIQLAWRAAEAVLGAGVFTLLNPLQMKGLMRGLSSRDVTELSGILAARVQNKEISQTDAGYAMGVMDAYLKGSDLPAGMTPEQRKQAEALLGQTIQTAGQRGLLTTLSQFFLPFTVVPQQAGAAELRQGQELYREVAYPDNQGGSRAAQRYVREQYPGIEPYWLRYNVKDPEGENPAIVARYQEFTDARDKIYGEMSLAVTKYILAKAGTVASYKAVKDIKEPFYKQVEELKKQYADVMEREFAPPNEEKMNPHERAVFEIEQILRHTGEGAPERPADNATPEQQVDAWNAINAWESAQLDAIERQIEAFNLSYEGGDPPAQNEWIAELQRLTNGQYASELLRKYEVLKYAGRVERQWSAFSSFQEELDNLPYKEREENVRARLGDAAVRTFQVYNRVKDENKDQYKEDHDNVALITIAAYNPEAWDAGLQLFGSDTWTTYNAYKQQKPLWPGDSASQEAKDAWSAKMAEVQKKYPQAAEIEFWVEGRHRYWYDYGESAVMTAVPGLTRDGKFGQDYDQAVALFGEDIFEVASKFPSGQGKKAIAQFYDKYPQYGAFSAWKKQYDSQADLTLADLQGLNMSMLPAEQGPTNASVRPWWAQFVPTPQGDLMEQGGPSRPLGSEREVINETPAQRKERIEANKKFQEAKKEQEAKRKAVIAQGRAATIDSTSYQDEVDKAYRKRYGRGRGSSRRYYGGGGGRRYGGGGGGGGYISSPGTDPSINPALWQQPRRTITQLNEGGINPSLWGSILERLRRPGR